MSAGEEVRDAIVALVRALGFDPADVTQVVIEPVDVTVTTTKVTPSGYAETRTTIRWT